MEIEDTPLFQEARDIMENGATQTNFGYRILIHYGDKLTLAPLKTVSLNNLRDYAKSFTDVMTLTVVMGLGDYARLIYPNRANLQVSIQKLPQGEQSETGDEDAPVDTEIFSATLNDKDRSPTDGQGAEANDIETLNLTQLVDVDFQLYNKALEQVRIITVGNNFRANTVDSALRSILTKESQKANVGQERAVVGVDMVPVSNKDKHEQLTITHGTKLIDVPDLLQNRYGIYSAGLGTYIQNKYWFIFPLYDTTQFEDRQQTLTIIVLPKRKYSDMERTYRKTGDSLTVLMTGETAFKDDSGTQYLKDGNGARFNDAGKLMDTVSNNTGNKAIISRKRNANEFTTDKRPDGIQHVPMAQTRITSNPFTVYSELAGRNGGLFKGVWQNADPKLLLPGMAVRIIYTDLGETKTLFGVLHGTQSVSHAVGDIKSEKFTTQTVVYVFVNKPIVNQAQ